MPLPDFDPELHDIGIAGKGWMTVGTGEAFARQDFAPGVAQAAEGESRADAIQTESFFAPADWEGGAGQDRHSAIDQYRQGVGLGQWSGKYFPPKALVTSQTPGGNTYYLDDATTLYQFEDQGGTSRIVKVGTASFQTISNTEDPAIRPIMSAAKTILWASEAGHVWRYRPDSGMLGIETDVTPPDLFVQGLVAYDRWIVAIGRNTIPTTPEVQASKTTGSGSSAQDNYVHATGPSATWKRPTKPGNTLVLIVVATASAGDVSFEDIQGPTDEAWVLVAKTATAGVYVKEGADSEAGTVTIKGGANADGGWTLAAHTILIEVAGLVTVGTVDEVSSNSGPASDTTIGSGSTGTLDQTNEFALFVASAEGSVSFSTPAGWTELSDTTYTNPWGAPNVAAAVFADTTSGTGALSPSTTISAAAVNRSGIVVTFRAASLDAAATNEQVVFAISGDDGQSWDLVGFASPTAMPEIVDVIAAYGYIWLTGDDGLYQLGIQENEFAGGTRTYDIGLAKVGKAQVPSGTTVGTQIAAFENAIFWTAGDSLHRFTIGGGDMAVWPPSDWATTSGTIQAMTASDTGLWLGAGGYLWNFNGRGWFPVAEEPHPGAFDSLHWFNGRLYVRRAPVGANAPYYDYLSPSRRPDLNTRASTTFTNGTVVQSLTDFGKVSAKKVATTFQSIVRFSQASDSGLVRLYALVDPSGDDPGYHGGAAASLAWQELGTHAVSDGYVKEFSVSPPLVFHRLHLRADLEVGASGYPMLEGLTVWARALMRSMKRFPVTLELATDTVDHQGGGLYLTDEDVAEALAFLSDLRDAANSPVTDTDPLPYITVSYPTSNHAAGVVEYVCTIGSFNDTVIGSIRDHGRGHVVTLQLDALP